MRPPDKCSASYLCVWGRIDLGGGINHSVAFRKDKKYGFRSIEPFSLFFLDRSVIMPGNKKHTLKNIKNREAAHPYSRKALQLQRVVMRSSKLSARKNDRSAANYRAEKWLWFRYALDESVKAATLQEVHDLIDTYIARNDDQLAEFEGELKKTGHRVKSPKHDLLLAQKAADENEYVSGIELPDLTDGKNLKRLRNWDGDMNGAALIKTRMFYKADREKLRSKEKVAAVQTKKPEAKAEMMDTN
ncbi:hypothetical protein BX666DRAFT_788932 [Dichotomocladium elegans]|nr:hypothetical protein BX666DRAFT_788932 [Dichotomocladium elegans]